MYVRQGCGSRGLRRQGYGMVWQTPTPTHTRYKSAIADDGSNRADWSGPSDAGSTTSLVGHGFHHGGFLGDRTNMANITTAAAPVSCFPNVDCSPHSASHRQSRWPHARHFASCWASSGQRVDPPPPPAPPLAPPALYRLVS